MSGLYPAQAEADHSNVPKTWGRVESMVNQTIVQDAGRSGDLVDMTLMAMISASRKWAPLRDVNPALTPGKLVCGAWGANLAATQAVTDGSCTVSINGQAAIEFSGLDFSGIAALDEIPDVFNANAAGALIFAWDQAALTIMSPILGTDSAVSVLTAGATGTDISGSGFMNGLTGTGTATAGTGGDGSELPFGLYRGGTITEAAIQAGDTTGDMVVPGDLYINEDDLVLENSLDLDTSIVVSKNMTLRTYMRSIGMTPQETKAADAQL